MLRKTSLLLLVGLLGWLSWAAATFVAGDGIPFYVHRNGAGSRVDLRSDGTHDGTAWSVVLRRSLKTGDPAHDIQFEPMGSYSYQVTTWDNSGDENHDISGASAVYRMEIPFAPGPLVFPTIPGVFEEIAGDYLDSGEIEIRVRWLDGTKNDQRKRWTLNGMWSQSSDNEDRMAFIWDMQGDEFASAGTCLAMCHPPNMYTAPGTKTDTWQWKATRTNPAGYGDDKWWDDGNGGTGSGRHSDPGQAPYSDNVANGLPGFMSEDDPGANARFLFEFLQGMKEATAYTDGAWSDGDSLPAYVMRKGSGSRVDTRATQTYGELAATGTTPPGVAEAAGHIGWTVTFRRKLDTGDVLSDITFQPGGTYYFQVTTFDNSGDAGHDISEASNVYSMTVPMTPGPLAFSDTPALFSSLSGELLASDEVLITVSWPDATQNDLRKLWTYGSGSWSQSSDNEDRVVFIWDMQHDMFASTGTCLAMCHPPNMYTAAGTKTDTWHHKASRTGPAGFTDDKFFDDGNGGTGSGRHSDPGKSVYMDNADNGGVPTFMAAGGPGTSASYLFDHAPAAGWSRAVPFVEDGEPPPACVPDQTTMCLNTGRFLVQVTWKDFQGNTGTGQVVPAGSDDSGLFWFFQDDNWEMLVKVLEGCFLNDRYWVFFAATTDVEFTMTVTDTDDGTMKSYTNPLGHPANAVTDTDAFATCP